MVALHKKKRRILQFYKKKEEKFSLKERRILQLKSMDELLMDLQVFVQEFLLREHLTMKFS